MTMDQALSTLLATEPEPRAARTGRILPFGKPGALLPGDLKAISHFAAQQSRAQLQFVELDRDRMIALLHIGASRIRIERRGAIALAHMGSPGKVIQSGSIEDLLKDLLATVQARPSAPISASAS
jgi:hypothetical protein